MDGENGEESKTSLEKIADVTLRLEPTPAEAATIGVDSNTPFDGDIRELIAGYVKARQDENQDFWDLSQAAFGGDVKDPDVREAFAARLAIFNEGRDPVQVLMEIGQKRGWSPDDVTFHAYLSSENFYDIVKRFRDTELRRRLRVL